MSWEYGPEGWFYSRSLKYQDTDDNCVAGEQDLKVPFADCLRCVQFNSVHDSTMFFFLLDMAQAGNVR